MKQILTGAIISFFLAFSQVTYALGEGKNVSYCPLLIGKVVVNLSTVLYAENVSARNGGAPLGSLHIRYENGEKLNFDVAHADKELGRINQAMLDCGKK